jgi:hypothetical protein
MSTIKTNNVPRDILRFEDLTQRQQQEVIDSYGAADAADWTGFVFKGQVWGLDEFARVTHMPGWDGAAAQSAFHGVLVRLVGTEQVVVGQMFS